MLPGSSLTCKNTPTGTSYLFIIAISQIKVLKMVSNEMRLIYFNPASLNIINLSGSIALVIILMQCHIIKYFGILNYRRLLSENSNTSLFLQSLFFWFKEVALPSFLVSFVPAIL